MATWNDLATAAPDLVRRVQARFTGHKHLMLATLRLGGAPRISGVEVQFSGGNLWMGMMAGSRKAADLQRDPRMALHSAPVDLNLTDGDAKVSGRALEVVDPAGIASWRGDLGYEPPGPFHLFRVDVDDMSIVTVSGDRLVIDAWRPDRGVWRVERT
jgi:Pyridoxamine 5'-phosphate oxidase